MQTLSIYTSSTSVNVHVLTGKKQIDFDYGTAFGARPKQHVCLESSHTQHSM